MSFGMDNVFIYLFQCVPCLRMCLDWWFITVYSQNDNEIYNWLYICSLVKGWCTLKESGVKAKFGIQIG